MKKIFFIFTAVLMMFGAVFLAGCQSGEDVAGEAAAAALGVCNRASVGQQKCAPNGYFYKCAKVSNTFKWINTKQKCRTNQPSCTDSDGGLNLLVKGTCTDTSGCTQGCADSCSTEAGYIEELYCPSPSGSCVTKFRTPCPTGDVTAATCDDGVCVVLEAKEPSCIDSDGGKNYTVKGYVNGGNDSGIAFIQQVDVCGDDKITLVEHYCDMSTSTNYNSEWYSCPNGCNDGACVKETTPPTPVAACTDADNDGYTPEMTGNCAKQPGDCDDSNLNIKPGAEELCFPDTIDNDCDGQVNEGCADNTNST